MPFSIPTHPTSGGGTGTVGRALLGAGTHPFGHHAGLVAGVMVSVHLCVSAEHADPSRIVPAYATEISHTTPPHDATQVEQGTHTCLHLHQLSSRLQCGHATASTCPASALPCQGSAFVGPIALWLEGPATLLCERTAPHLLINRSRRRPAAISTTATPTSTITIYVRKASFRPIKPAEFGGDTKIRSEAVCDRPHLRRVTTGCIHLMEPVGEKDWCRADQYA